MLLSNISLGAVVIEVQIRKQGSSAIMTLPSDALKIMGEQIGNTLLVDVQAGKLTAISTKKPVQGRYKLSELLAGVTPEAMESLYTESAAIQTGGAIGAKLP